MQISENIDGYDAVVQLLVITSQIQEVWDYNGEERQMFKDLKTSSVKTEYFKIL